MFFHLTELEHHPIHFDLRYNPGEIELSEDVRQTGVLHAEGKAELLRNTNGEIRVRGRVSVNLETDCYRCLEPAAVPIDAGFDLFYRPAPQSNGTQHPEVHLEEGEIDLSFYEGDGLSLREVLREFLLLSLPMQIFCRPDCQGLCPVCGANRNQEACGCVAQKVDPRWEALKNL